MVPAFFDNAREATVIGAEVAADFEISESWKVRSGFTFLDLKFEGDVVGTPIQPQTDAEEPNFVANPRSYLSITQDLDWDIGLYAVDRLDDLRVGAYMRVDTRLAYRPGPTLELVLGAQNLTQGQHDEFATTLLSSATDAERTVYFGVTWNP